MNLLQKFDNKQIEKLHADKEIPDFKAGDTLKVHVRIIEGNNERVQVFEGLCIGRKNRGLHSTFMVRKISHGEGVERIFDYYSPKIEKIEVVKRGTVRRAKLYYMRELRGKAARIKEKMNFGAPKAKKEKTATKPTTKEEAPKKAETKPKATPKKEDDK